MERHFSIFMTTLMIAIPVGAVIILIIYAFGFVAIPEEKTTYEFIKDHGSLIAGLIGFGGVAWLIINQNRETNKLIKSEYKKIKYEVFEKNKDRALNHLHFVNQKLEVNRQIGILLKSGKNIVTSDYFHRDFFNPMFDELYCLFSYTEKIDGSLYSREVVKSATFLFHLMQESLYYSDHDDENVFWIYQSRLTESLEKLKAIGDARNSLPYDGFRYCVDVDGKKYSLQDIINGISSNSDLRTLDEMYKYLGACFIWIKGVFKHGFDDEIKQISFRED